MLPLQSLPRFIPVLVRHFSAYLDLFADDAAELGSHVARRLIAIIVTLLALSFALAMACIWILSAVWDTPWRDVAIGCMLGVFTLATIIAWFVAARRLSAEWSPFNRLRAEWMLDRQLITELELPEVQQPREAQPASRRAR